MLRDFILKIKNKRHFNVNSKVDREIYRNFLVKGGWGSEGCPFLLEEPYNSIPYMIQEKIVCKTLNIA